MIDQIGQEAAAMPCETGQVINQSRANASTFSQKRATARILMS